MKKGNLHSLLAERKRKALEFTQIVYCPLMSQMMSLVQQALPAMLGS